MDGTDDISGGQPRNFLRPVLLLLVLEGPAHGYELLERLRVFGFARIDPGGVYRVLRTLEREALVRSAWETSAAGPARRTYTVTADGAEQLRAWALVIEESRGTLEAFLDRYAIGAEATARLGGDATRLR